MLTAISINEIMFKFMNTNTANVNRAAFAQRMGDVHQRQSTDDYKPNES